MCAAIHEEWVQAHAQQCALHLYVLPCTATELLLDCHRNPPTASRAACVHLPKKFLSAEESRPEIDSMMLYFC